MMLTSAVIDDSHEAGIGDAADDPIGAFYTSHPYPPPVADLERQRQAWQTPESTPRRVSPALADERIPGRSGHPGRRVRHVPGGEARDLLATGARVGDRHQRDESRAHERARAQAQPDESRRHAAANRAGARPRPHLRPDYLHRRPAPSRRSRRWSSSAAIGAEARGGHAPDGLCALRAYRRVHAAGVLPPSRHRHFSERHRAARRRAKVTAASPPALRTCGPVEGFRAGGRAGGHAAEPARPRVLGAATVRVHRGRRPRIQALVPAGPVPAAVRGHGSVATQRQADCPRSTRAVRRGRTVARFDGSTQSNRRAEGDPARLACDPI